MTKYVMRHYGEVVAEADLLYIKGHSGVIVLDESPRMLLIQATRPTIDEMKSKLPDWGITEEVMIPMPPKFHAKIRKGS